MPKRSITEPLLYKYRKSDEHTIALLSGEIYFAPPRELNDPSDLDLAHSAELQLEQRVKRLQNQIEHVEAREGSISDELDDYEQGLRRIAQETHVPEPEEIDLDFDEYQVFLAESAQEHELKIQRQVEGYLQKLRIERAQQREKLETSRSELRDLERAWDATKHIILANSGAGVLCLTTEAANYRMWTLYADGFRGVCVGFDRERLTAALGALGLTIVGPLQVIYRKITIDDLVKPRFVKRPENLYCYKPPDWSREKEVRFVWRDGSGTVTLPASCVTKIVVGQGVSTEYRNRIAVAITRRVQNAEKDDGPFSVEQASGDSAGQVHIGTDPKLDSVVRDYRNTLFEKEWNDHHEDRSDEDDDDLLF